MAKTKEQIMKELKIASEKLRTEASVAQRAAKPAAPPIMEAAKKAYAGIPKLTKKPEAPAPGEAGKKVEVAVGAGSGTASYVLVDHSCEYDYKLLWAYVGDAWRYKWLNDGEMAGIAKVVMEANWLDVWFGDDNIITYLRCWKQY